MTLGRVSAGLLLWLDTEGTEGGMSDMLKEFRRCQNLEGNEPIRCSRMHFKEWAAKLDALTARLAEAQARESTLRGLLREAADNPTWVNGLLRSTLTRDWYVEARAALEGKT